jgi:hypothetical protein
LCRLNPSQCHIHPLHVATVVVSHAFGSLSNLCAAVGGGLLNIRVRDVVCERVSSRRVKTSNIEIHLGGIYDELRPAARREYSVGAGVSKIHSSDVDNLG